MSTAGPAPAPAAPLALGLFSGGLDSLLAAQVIRRQGVRVRLYQFITPFFGWRLRGREEAESRRVAARHGLELVVRPVWPDYLEVVRRPVFGYGKNLNPCLDCKLFMLRLVAAEREKLGAAFVFTGEVLGQRPMSQRRDTLHLLENKSGLKGRLVRPLSARLLPPSIPETEGLLDRERLLDLRGRSRKPQIRLAAELGLQDYPAPAGGCLLTDPGYAKRLRALLEEKGEPELSDVELLALGRHFHPSPGVRLVVGRNRPENESLCHLAGPSDLLLAAEGIPGPTSLLRGPFDRSDVLLAARFTARYADHGGAATVTVVLCRRGAPEERLPVTPADPSEVDQKRGQIHS